MTRRAHMKRKTAWGAGVLALVVVVTIWYRWDPAAAVANRTAVALENRDARTLYNLASADEVAALGLTEARIGALLRGTVWREGAPGRLRVTPDHIGLANVRRFTLTQAQPRDPAMKWHNIMQVFVRQRGPGRPWELNLSWVLKTSHMVRPNPANPASATSIDQAYRNDAERLGIRGYDLPNHWERYIFAYNRWVKIR